MDFLPEAQIINGWPQNPSWDSAKSGDAPGAQLLGEDQEKFLAEWVRDWEGAEMKCVVSGSILCNLATLPKSFMSDSGVPGLPVYPLGGYAPDDKAVQDHDSNGWPQTARNRTLRLMRAALAPHLSGDQHLGSTVQYGADAWNDSVYGLCTPAISNLFPRRWFPPVDGKNRKPGQVRNMGEFVDGFGNRITVHAVANPYNTGLKPAALFDRVTGYGLVEFDKTARTYKLENYPRWVVYGSQGAEPFPGWPIVVSQPDNGLQACQWELKLAAPANGVVDVRNSAGETVLCYRTSGAVDTLPVWAGGEYEVLVNGATTGKVAAKPKQG